MDLEDILGLTAEDFDGVEEDVASQQSDDDTATPLELPLRKPLEPTELCRNDVAAVESSEGIRRDDGDNAVKVPESGHSSPVTSVQPTASTSIQNGIFSTTLNSYSSVTAESVDAERGRLLPEHLCGQDKALSFLRRMERCCLESHSAEIERAVAELSSNLDDTCSGTLSANQSNGVGYVGNVEGTEAPDWALSDWSKRIPAVGRAALGACHAALRVCQGEYEDLLRETALFEPSAAAAVNLAATAPGYGAIGEGTAEKNIIARAKAFVVGTTSSNMVGVEAGDNPAVWRAAEAMWVAAAALSLFFQENYTGPELGSARKESLGTWFAEKLGLLNSPTGGETNSSVLAQEGEASDRGIGVGQDAVNVALSCDGELPYPKSGLAASLLTARQILVVLATPARPISWSAGLHASALGAKQQQETEQEEGDNDEVFRAAAGSLSSASWWSARACVAHARLLLSSDRSETLWREALALFGTSIRDFGGGVGVESGAGHKGVVSDHEAAVMRRVAAQVWLEWGLAQHHFQDPSKGKASFSRAKEASGLTAALTGALGKRTKDQQSQLAQLVLIAASASATTSSSSKVPTTGDTPPAGELDAAGTLNITEPKRMLPQSRTWPPTPEVEGGTEVVRPAVEVDASHTREAAAANGRREHGDEAAVRRPELGMSTTVGEGEERAAARRIQHAEDSELLDDIDFVERELESPGKLEDIDLAIILGLCLDVSNSNPRDGLTNEEMTPYIARVLRQPGCNWMIYSTALLQRSWVEFERSHARDRAALQIQALLDQHTTKLTYTQSTTQAVEDSAPAQDRIRYLSSLSFPPRWELRRDLAQRYAGMGVFGSAAEEFVELEMWEEAVECYRQMQQVNKAEKIARERLKEQETAPMWAALGDLTQDPSCWEKAWELSGGRYARAKVSLARHRFSEADYEGACSHFEQALAMKPLLPAAWFTLGVARMRLGRWPESLEAFSRVAQQEPEEGEAWGNMGAVHMHEGNWSSASACFTEGLKHMPGNWRMWENQGEALLRMGKWSSAVYACHRMLDLSDKSKRGIEPNYLAVLVEGALKQEPRPALGDSTASAGANDSPSSGSSSSPHATSTAVTGANSTDDLAGRPLCKQVAELLGRVVSTTRGDARVWEVYARFNEGAGRDRARVLDCVTKQCRALQSSSWEKNADAVAKLAAASDKLVELYMQEGTRQSLYQAKMHLATAARKVNTAEVCAGCPGHERIFSLLHTVEGVLTELKTKEAGGGGDA